MRRWALDLLVGAAGVGLGAALAGSWGEAPEDLRPAPAPEAPGSAPCPPAVIASPAVREDELPELREAIAELEAEGHRIGALPAPWPEDPPPHMRPEAVRAVLARDTEGWQIQVDCSEYPCVVLAQGGPELDLAPTPDFPFGYGMFGASDPSGQRDAFYPLEQGGTLPVDVERRLKVRQKTLVAPW